MTLPVVRCPSCDVLLEVQGIGTAGFTPCIGCAVPVRVDSFPALFLQPGTSGPEAITDEVQSSCFFHAGKKAVRTCGHCGRFVCSLCDIDLGEEHLCPACFESGSRKKKLRSLESYRILHDDVALALAIIPMIFVFVTCITAPIALFYAARHWKSPSSIIPRRSRLRLAAAIVLASVQICIWSIGIWYAAMY